MNEALKSPKNADILQFILEYNTSTTTPPHKTSWGEPLSYDQKELVIKENRAERYRVQGVARMLFAREGERQNLEHPFNYHRSAKCLHTRINPLVDINYSADTERAFYGGLAICGSVWSCPVCAAKIQERRREEISKTMEKVYKERKKKCIMVTLTFPHLSFDRVDDLLKKQATALYKLRSGKPWTKIKEQVGYFGLIRSLELTYGDNGYHPHTHEIWIVDKDCDAFKLKMRVIERWASACKRAGLLDDSNFHNFWNHSVDIKDNARNSDYLAKQDDSRHWGADRELAKASSKKGKKKGVHPFQFLTDFENGDSQAGERWIEYSMAVKGRNQLFWSRGLKEWAGLDEKTDDEAAKEELGTIDLLSQLTKEQWSTVLKHDARAKILTIAENEGREGLKRWLESHTVSEWVIES